MQFGRMKRREFITLLGGGYLLNRNGCVLPGNVAKSVGRQQKDEQTLRSHAHRDNSLRRE